MQPRPDHDHNTAGLTPTHLLAVLLPLLLLYFTFRFLDLTPGLLTPSVIRDIIFGRPRSRSRSPNLSSTSNSNSSNPTTNSIPPYFSLHRAIASYDAYPALALAEHAAMQRSYARLTYAHRRTGYALGYTRKLEGLRRAEEVNAGVLRAVAGLARVQFAWGEGGDGEGGERGEGGMGLWAMMKWVMWREEDVRPDVGRVREAMKHFVRDWSEEGKEERGKIFEPILRVMRQSEEEGRKGEKVLVPGSGLGRLAWEVAELGYDTTAIELSYFMTLAFRFLLSPQTTQTPNQHTVHPYAYWFSHSRSSTNTLRGISFPDVVPRLQNNFHLIEGDFLTHNPSQNASYDYVVTLFFIDTSTNIISTLEHIYALLKPGGTWINLGPLLWTGGAQARMELSLEEVLELAETVEFRMAGEEDEVRRRRTVECEYTADRTAMMKWLYQAEFWVATKPA
ncbi:hypothetical protein EIP91_006526 [Steccherinum ochraceum]|uniref:Uncharacterized protein n=1 Tax=Steccherinum ochraceum TaxID=92696 RepID=A0A4R0R5J9_9APHY|nr:hypothetical protein EIP91_006526 [Steccherinum ochraceum]